jgi:hypothetical protein
MKDILDGSEVQWNGLGSLRNDTVYVISAGCSEKHAKASMYSVFVTLWSTEGNDNMNKISLSWRVCVHVVLMRTRVQYEIYRPHGLAVNEPKSCQFCHTACHCDIFSKNFKFRFQLLNSVRVCAVYTSYEASPKEINAGIEVRWTWWPGPPKPGALWKSIRHDTAWCSRRYSLYVDGHRPPKQRFAYASSLTFRVPATTSSLLLQRAPVNSNYYIRWLVAIGVCHLLNFLRNCLCTAKLLAW